MSHTVVMLLTFLAGFLTVFAINMVVVDLMHQSRKRMRERMEAEFRTQQRQRARESLQYKDLSQLAAEGFGDEEAAPGWAEWGRLWIDQSGLNVTMLRLGGFMAASAAGIGSIGLLLFRNVAVGISAAVLGALIPVLYVAAKRHARMEKMRTQLPDAFDLMSRILRAGQTISQGLQAVADEFSPPLGNEFGYCYEQQNLGLSTEDAVRDLARRTGLLEVKIFVLAVMIHRQTGGNLAQLLEKLASVVRERFRIRGLIRTLTAEGRLQAVILLGLPPALLFMMLFINRDYTMVLFQYPLILAGMFVSMLIGALWIKKIVSFDF